MVNSRGSQENKKFLTTAEAARLLGISRVAVFQKIQRGEIRAERVGRNYIIPIHALFEQRKSGMTEKEKKQIKIAVKKVVKDFAEVLWLLGKE